MHGDINNLEADFQICRVKAQKTIQALLNIVIQNYYTIQIHYKIRQLYSEAKTSRFNIPLKRMFGGTGPQTLF
jgi:hypothetical protein